MCFQDSFSRIILFTAIKQFFFWFTAFLNRYLLAILNFNSCSCRFWLLVLITINSFLQHLFKVVFRYSDRLIDRLSLTILYLGNCWLDWFAKCLPVFSFEVYFVISLLFYLRSRPVNIFLIRKVLPVLQFIFVWQTRQSCYFRWLSFIIWPLNLLFFSLLLCLPWTWPHYRPFIIIKLLVLPSTIIFSLALSRRPETHTGFMIFNLRFIN